MTALAATIAAVIAPWRTTARAWLSSIGSHVTGPPGNSACG